jgi:hypothetical protein
VVYFLLVQAAIYQQRFDYWITAAEVSVEIGAWKSSTLAENFSAISGSRFGIENTRFLESLERVRI